MKSKMRTKTLSGMIPYLAACLALTSPLQAQIGALESVHPSYDLTTMRPNGFEPSISGIDFLSDGRAVITTYPFTGHNYEVNSKVYILEGLTGDSRQDVNPIEVPLSFTDAMDPLVVDDEIYIMERNFFSKLVDTDNDGVPDEKDVIYTGWINNDRSWTFDVEHYDGNFYLAMGVAMPNAQPTRSTESDLRGCLMRIMPNGQADCIAWGLRQPNGLAINEDGEFFVTDNQGQWLPANKFTHVVPGNFYGLRESSNGGNTNETPPSLWLTHVEIAMSPTKPIQIKDGIYAGQWLFADVSYGGIQRAYLEKINGEYQGAVFRFSGGLEAGMNEVEIGPDGHIYAVGLGNGSATDNWGLYQSTTGLQRLAFNGDTTFEVLSIRSSNNGFAVDFTKPVSATAANPSSYEMDMYWFQPTSAYGGRKKDPDAYPNPENGTRSLSVQSITVSDDNKTVLLEVPNLMDDAMVVHFDFSSIRSQTGESLWDNEAWYTIHNFGPEIVDVVEQPAAKKDRRILSRFSEGAVHFEIEGLSKGTYELRDLRGQLAASGQFSEGRFTLSREGLMGAYFVKVKSNQYSSIKKLVLY